MKRLCNIEKLIRKFVINTNSETNEIFLAKLLNAQAEHLKGLKLSRHSDISREHFMVHFPRLGWVCGFAAIFIAIIACLYSYILAEKVTVLRDELKVAQQDIANTPIDDSVTINFYLKEHQDTIARYASNELTISQSVQMQINEYDIMYYEFLDDDPKFFNSGMIVRGSSSQQEIESSESPTISNGYILTISEAREASDFDLISPSWIDPGYKLGQIKKIEDYDTFQLLYIDGINSVSLFEQPLDGQRGLSHHDFREYAVYNNQGEGGGIILAWRDDSLSYVLIGNIEMSKLMDMAQSISAIK